ncbi:MAG: hypothetical protein JWR60_704 [Polaromonas sp.]|nr:hypothetical protein [Polaromonas sp.]
MSPEDMEEKIAMLTQQMAAVADVVAIICAEVAQLDEPTARRVASSLEAMADNPNIGTTAAFAQLAPWFAEHLRQNMDQCFFSLHERSASDSGLQALQALMHKLKK